MKKFKNKVLKNQELINIKGGEEGNCTCHTDSLCTSPHQGGVQGGAHTPKDCQEGCGAASVRFSKFNGGACLPSIM